VLLPALFFGPIDYFALIARSEELIFDSHEHFKKQTYRNRCEVLGPNGTFKMLLPVRRRNHSPMVEVTIAEEEKWRRLHLKTLGSFYRSSSYFEFYEHRIDEFYARKFENLFELNMASTALACELLDIPFNFKTSTEFIPYAEDDLRLKIHPKSSSLTTQSSYHQVFSDRFEFQPNLSVLDLLFNRGPQAREYLLGLKL
jgi:hypothetical protein